MGINIDNALENMGKNDRELVKKYIAEYRRTGDVRYFEMAIAIIQNFDDDVAKELKRTLR